MVWERRKIVFALLAFFIVLTANLYIPLRWFNSWGLRAEHFMMVVLMMMGIIQILEGRVLKVHVSEFSLLIVAFSFFILASIANAFVQGQPVILRDFTEIYRVFVAFAVVTVAGTYVLHEKEKLQAITILHGFIVVAAIIAFTQFFDVGGLNAVYVPSIAPVHFITLVRGYPFPRVVGMTSNPNHFAYLSAIGTLLGVTVFFRKKHWAYAVTSGLVFISLLMTRSRTGFLTLVVMLIVFALLQMNAYFANKPKSRWKHYYYILLGIGVPAFLFALLYVFPHSFTWRLREIFSFSTATSWQARVDRWRYFWVLFVRNPILGSGPAKGKPFGLAVDNEWLLLMMRYGVVGLGAILAIILVPTIRRIQELLYRDSGIVYLSVLAGSAVFMITGGVLHTFQTLALLMVLVGVVWGGEERLIIISKKGIKRARTEVTKTSGLCATTERVKNSGF